MGFGNGVETATPTERSVGSKAGLIPPVACTLEMVIPAGAELRMMAAPFSARLQESLSLSSAGPSKLANPTTRTVAPVVRPRANVPRRVSSADAKSSQFTSKRNRMDGGLIVGSGVHPGVAGTTVPQERWIMAPLPDRRCWTTCVSS
jgi:hypothetical protein